MADAEHDIFSSGALPDPGSAPVPPSFAPTQPPDQRALSEALARTVEEGNRERDARYRSSVPTVPQARAPSAPSEAPAGQQPQEPPRHVPLPEYLDIRDRAQRAERERDELKRLADESKRAKELPIDVELFQNPQAVLDRQRTMFEQAIQNLRLEQSFGLAAVRHGDTYDKAMESWVERCRTGQDPQAYFAVVNAPQPGEAMVKWWKQEQAVARFGNDPDAYEQQLREKLLNDPQFLSELYSRGGGVPQLAPPQRPAHHAERGDNGQFVPRHEVRPPSSLSRLNGAATRETDLIDGSEDAIFNAGRAPPSRGR